MENNKKVEESFNVMIDPQLLKEHLHVMTPDEEDKLKKVVAEMAKLFPCKTTANEK